MTTTFIKASTNTRRTQAGVGLVEVMVAILVLAIGALGIAALQAITLKNSGGSSERTQAAVQMHTMLDTLRMQRTAAAAGSLNTSDFRCSEATALGTPGTLDGWLDDIKKTVSPSACGKVSCATTSAGTRCTVSVRWNDSRATGGQNEQSVSASTTF